jgi:serine/threonine-protein kinase
MALEIGQVIEQKYRVVGLIGEGGMGAVYEGENVRIRRRVAIKTLHANIARNEQVVARFEREAQAAGRIGSDHILEVLDLGALPTGERFIVMEFLDGEPLSKRIARHGRLTSAQLIPIMRQVLEGLGAAHAAGIIHRDLKPDNVYILRQKAGIADFVKIIDFGISKFHSDQQGSVAMTQAGSLMGTPLYMSPEQANGSAEADARSDIYSLGIIMYEALSGRTPFSSQNLNELLFKIVLSDIPRLETVAAGVEPSVAAIVAKATSKKREERFGSAQEMLAALDVARMTLPPATAPYFASGAAGSGRPPPPQTVHTPSGPVLARRTPTPLVTPQQVLWHTPSRQTPGPQVGGTPLPQGGQTPWPLTQAPGDRTAVGTNGAWGHRSDAPFPVPPAKSKAPLFAGIAVGSLLVLLGGGFAVSRVVSRPKAAAAAASTPVQPAASSEPTVATTAAPPAMAAAHVADAVPSLSATAPTASASLPAPSGTAAVPVVTGSGRPDGASPLPRVTKPAPATPPRGKASKKSDWGY